VTDDVLADQVDYYRRRAGEYDVTAYGDVAAARARIARLVAEMRPTGCVLEIACGTGLWTEELAGLADTVTAIDAAPEAVEIARDRVRSANVSFEVADVFSWHRYVGTGWPGGTRGGNRDRTRWGWVYLGGRPV